MNINHLLLIDDDEVNNFLVEEILRETPLLGRFTVKLSGEEALTYLENCAEGSLFPDLILVDLKMPQMDGFEFVEHYEQQFKAAHPQTQLMMLTSSLREADKQQALSYPTVRNFLNKPLDDQKLQTIAKLFAENQLLLKG